MKRSLSLLLLCSIAGITTITHASDSCDIENTGKSYLAPLPHFQLASPEYITAFRSDRIRMEEDCWTAGFQAVLFGSKSSNEKDLTRYFFPGGKTSLVVAEDTDENPDLFAQHFNIFTNEGDFLSKIRIEPKQTVIGVGFGYRQSFCRDEEKNRGFWFAATAPLMRVKNDLNLCEKIDRDGGGANETADENVVANMKQAFNQKEWKFGKISPTSLKKTRLANIDLQIGYEKLNWEPCHMETYIGVHIPTGNKPEGEFLYEPVVGFGQHAGILWGGTFGVHIWDNECNDMHVRMVYATHCKYLFEKEQTRSFDLKNKPWGRYIEVYKDIEQAQTAAGLDANDPQRVNLATPGINVFTQCVDVKPGFIKDITTSVILDWKDCFQLEGGYHFHSRGSECVELASKWKEVSAIKHLSGVGQTNPIRDITGNQFLEQLVLELVTNNQLIPVSVDDFDNSIIKESDLDLSSAATPCMLVHTIYASGTYDFDYCDRPLFANLGVSYAFSGINNAVHDRWTLWLKGGISF